MAKLAVWRVDGAENGLPVPDSQDSRWPWGRRVIVGHAVIGMVPVASRERATWQFALFN